MLKQLLFAIVTAALLCCSSKKSNQTILQQQYKDSLTNALQQIWKDSAQFKGFSVALVNEEGTLYANGFGHANSSGKSYTANTIQNIASVSKTLVGIAVLKAQELGKLRLDDAINKYLPYKILHPAFPDSAITIRHLVTHTSGIIDGEAYLKKAYYLKKEQDLNGLLTQVDEEQVINPAIDAVDLSAFLQNTLYEKGKWYSKNNFTKNSPGKIFEYSNTGTALAAYIVELAASKNFSAFTKEHILQPLKMIASGWQFSEINENDYSQLYLIPDSAIAHYSLATYPDGNFITSADDLSKFLTELIKGYSGKGTILSATSYKILFTPALAPSQFTERNEKNPYNDTYNYSVFMGFSVAGNIGHTGGDPGVSTIMFIDPVTKTGRLLIVNTNIVNKEGGRQFYAIFDTLAKYGKKLTAIN
jgi:CubicO group peptidase (beta-lactamase class C family)